MPAGRPTKLTPELAQKLCDALGHMPAYQACEHVGIDNQTLYNWAQKDAEFFGNSARARAIFALRQLDEGEQLLADGVEPKEVPLMRERLHHYRWKCARLLKGIFSERQEVTGADGGPAGVIVVPAAIAPEQWAEYAKQNAEAIQSAVANGSGSVPSDD